MSPGGSAASMRGALLATSLVLLAVMLAGCVDENGDEGATRKVKDMLGREVKVPLDVERVIGVGAGALRYLVYLGCQERVVGVEDIETDDGRPYTFAHPELQDLPVIGPMFGGDAELITSREPDVVFWTYTTADDADELSEKTGVPVVALEYGDMGGARETAFEAFRLMADIMGVQERAEELTTHIDSAVEDLANRTSGAAGDDGAECYVGAIGYMGFHGLLSTEPAYPPFELVDADNCAGGLGVEHAFIDKEKLLDMDPDILFIDEGGIDLALEDLEDPAFRTLTAVREGEVYGLLPYNWYTSNFGTVLGNAYYVGTVLYPEAFADIDPAQMLGNIYETLLGKDVYANVEGMFGGYMKLDV